MGWFDEDDSEEEHEQHEQANVDDNEDAEEDPLDAYMNSLNASTETTTKTATRHASERLDIHNADEATSHWNESTDRHDSIESKNVDEDYNDSARLALETTFHRAGGDNNNTKSRRNDKFAALTPVQHKEMEYKDFSKHFWTPSDTPRGHAWRKEHEVTCQPGNIDPILSFQECRLVLGDDVFQRIQRQKFTTPTLVQSQTLPVALAGKDALVTASTGSGKTLSYILPLVVHLQHSSPLLVEETGPLALVLVPTRELAMQVHKQLKTMLPSNLSSLAIIGGISNYHLLKDLKMTGCHAVVATPGRFLDLLGKKNKGLSLTRVTFVVLDEADRMLSLGFEEQVTSILKNVRPDRQSLMLSATMGGKVQRVAQEWLTDPFRIAIGKTGESSQHVEQHVMVLPSYRAKKEWLLEMLPILSQVGRTLVFVATRNECEELALIMREKQSLQVETLHGEKHQSDRSASLRAFSNGENTALIATDVAARGLDVQNVSTVVSFDPAKNLDAHVHRIGRAGRLSKDKQNKGVAYTLLTPKNADFAHVLVNAFQREGRDVSSELQALAEKSRRSGNVASRNKWNKSGIGFHDKDPSHDESLMSSGIGYYGPSLSDVEPRAKRSRWE